MAGVKGRSGGARKGAGRPKRKPAATAPAGEASLDAQGYLEAVVAGLVDPDPTRVRAAQTLMRFQRTPVRAPPPAPRPKELVVRNAAEADARQRAEWEITAAAIRRKHGRA